MNRPTKYQYRKTQRRILETREHCCAGCGRYDLKLTFSHRIPRSRRIDLLTDPENIDLMCLDCHDKVKTGKYNELINGPEILAYIERMEPELYYLKTA